MDKSKLKKKIIDMTFQFQSLSMFNVDVSSQSEECSPAPQV